MSEVLALKRWVVTKILLITAGEFWLMLNGLKAVAGFVSSNAARSALLSTIPPKRWVR